MPFIPIFRSDNLVSMSTDYLSNFILFSFFGGVELSRDYFLKENFYLSYRYSFISLNWYQQANLLTPILDRIIAR